MEKIDLKRQLKLQCAAPADVVTAIDVPALRFLMVDGRVDPNTSAA